VEHAAEVLEPDVYALMRDELRKPVLLEREPDEDVDRVAEDRRQRGDDR
jgi:hypothetical protein